jgi:hypothetical protein
MTSEDCYMIGTDLMVHHDVDDDDDDDRMCRDAYETRMKSVCEKKSKDNAFTNQWLVGLNFMTSFVNPKQN